MSIDDEHGTLGLLTAAIGAAGGIIGAVDLVEVDGTSSVRDIVVDASGREHWGQILAAIEAVAGVRVIETTDRTFLLHVGGKIETRAKLSIRTRRLGLVTALSLTWAFSLVRNEYPELPGRRLCAGPISW